MRRLALAGAIICLAGCGGGRETATVVLEPEENRPTTLTVEVADSVEERRQGLSGREELAADAGMLFRFDEPVTNRFWMKDTLVPLSIAFIDASGRIVALRDMQPCRGDPCPTYGAGEPYTAALEVNLGAFRRWGVEVGDRVRIEDGAS